MRRSGPVIACLVATILLVFGQGPGARSPFGVRAIAAPQFPHLPSGLGSLAHRFSLDKFLKPGPVLTTSMADATGRLGPLPGDVGVGRFASLFSLPRGPRGEFILRPGDYSAFVQSFCLQPGARAATHGDGFASAPLEGPWADIFEKVIRGAARVPAVPQENLQVLLWGMLARTKVSAMPRELQAAATAVLSPKDLLRINGGALSLVPKSVLDDAADRLPAGAREAFEAESRIRQMFADGVSSYEAFERQAVPDADEALDQGLDLSVDEWIDAGRGFYIRFLPLGYRNVRVEIVVPPQPGRQARADGPPLLRLAAWSPAAQPQPEAVRTPELDLSAMVAVPADNGQRLGLTTRQSEDIGPTENDDWSLSTTTNQTTESASGAQTPVVPQGLPANLPGDIARHAGAARPPAEPRTGNAPGRPSAAGKVPPVIGQAPGNRPTAGAVPPVAGQAPGRRPTAGAAPPVVGQAPGKRPTAGAVPAAGQAPGKRPAPGVVPPAVDIWPSIRDVAVNELRASGWEYRITGANLGGALTVSIGQMTYAATVVNGQNGDGADVLFTIPGSDLANDETRAALGQLVLHLTDGRSVAYSATPAITYVRGYHTEDSDTWQYHVVGDKLMTVVYLQVGSKRFRPFWETGNASRSTVDFQISRPDFIDLTQVDTPQLQVVTMGGRAGDNTPPRIRKIIHNYDYGGTDLLWGDHLSSAFSVGLQGWAHSQTNICISGTPDGAGLFGADCLAVHIIGSDNGAADNVTLRTMGGNIVFSVPRDAAGPPPHH